MNEIFDETFKEKSTSVSDLKNRTKKQSGKNSASAKARSSDASNSPIVTIDGPAASGKSSVSRELARRFQWDWVSTGTFYRGLAWAANDSGLDLNDEAALVKFAESDRWEVLLTAQTTRFVFDGVDRTDDIGKESVGALASKISSYPLVRKALLEAQRACALTGRGLIAEGRDCGTVVFPKAQVKVFLTANPEDRAQRRALEEGRSLESTIDEQERRDRQDASRATAPMVASEAAYQLDTTGLSLEAVADQIEARVRLTLNLDLTGAAPRPLK